MIVFVVVYLAVYFSATIAVGYAMFSPFRADVGKEASQGARFRLTDLLAAFIPFQLGFAAVNAFFPDINWSVSVSVALAIALLAASSVTWIYGMQLLWRMKVEKTAKRVVLLGFVMPVGCSISVLALPILISSGGSVSRLTFRAIALLVSIVAIRLLVLWIRSSQAQLEEVEAEAG